MKKKHLEIAKYTSPTKSRRNVNIQFKMTLESFFTAKRGDISHAVFGIVKLQVQGPNLELTLLSHSNNNKNNKNNNKKNKNNKNKNHKFSKKMVLSVRNQTTRVMAKLEVNFIN